MITCDNGRLSVRTKISKWKIRVYFNGVGVDEMTAYGHADKLKIIQRLTLQGYQCTEKFLGLVELSEAYNVGIVK